MFGYRNGKGAVVVDGKQVGETHQCVHCSGHFETKPGSGTLRGFCRGCKGVTCGATYCMKFCTPFEARIDLTEAIGKRHLNDVRRITQQYPHIQPI